MIINERQISGLPFQKGLCSAVVRWWDFPAARVLYMAATEFPFGIRVCAISLLGTNDIVAK